MRIVRATSGAGSFEKLLRSELVSRKIDLCDEAGPHERPAIAAVELVPREGGAVIAIDVRDAITAKSVSRDVDLTTIPADGQSFTLALAADELLRASWAELALATAPHPARPVPIAVSETIEQSLAPPSPRPPLGAIGAVAAFDHYAGGQTAFGADARGAIWLTPRFAGQARVGLRAASTATGADGDVHATAIIAGLGLAFTMTPPSARAGLDAVARFDVEHVSYLAEARPGARGGAASGTAVLASAGAAAFWMLGGRVRIVAELLASAPLRPIAATDGGARVTAVSGLGVMTGIGACATF